MCSLPAEPQILFSLSRKDMSVPYVIQYLPKRNTCKTTISFYAEERMKARTKGSFNVTSEQLFREGMSAHYQG